MRQYIVTGHQNGRSEFIGNGSPLGIVTCSATPGMEVSNIWATSPRPAVGENAARPAGKEATFLPAVGETRFYILKFPPDSLMQHPDFDLAAAAKEFAELLPEMAAIREAADPGMHRTDTVDHIVVLEGEVWLELDDEQEVLLRQHDVVVQNGTRHAWRNRSDLPVVLAVVMVGAERRG